MFRLIRKTLYIILKEQSNDRFRIIRKSYARYKKHGFEGMVKRLEKEYEKAILLTQGINANNLDKNANDYDRWIEQNEKDILQTKPLAYTPLISVITPVYNTPLRYLEEMIESVIAQTYVHWELCIADDASSQANVKKALKRYAQQYENIKVVFRQTNGHISEASNSALALAKGEYVVFLDHDDMLAPNALYEFVKKLNEKKNLQFIYADEDKIDENANRFQPHFKSGWNPEMFLSQNYIAHPVCIAKKLVDAAGGFRKGFEGSQDYDLFLRVIEQLDPDKIDRIEKVLYHWRAIKGSTALSPEEKSYTTQAGIKALQEHLDKVHPGAVALGGMLPNTYKVVYPLHTTPLVSIIIPTRDGYEILKKCVESIYAKTTYVNFEIIIVDNQTTDIQTLNYFKTLQNQHKSTLRILKYNSPFNYSAINNFAVAQAKGEVVVLLNNDIEIISRSWLSEMLQFALQEGTGAVGAKLYYDNDTIQHAGVVLGIGGVAGHSHKYFPKEHNGYFSRLRIIQNFSAVTGACLMVRKKLYEEVGGLDEKNLKVAFNDVDFCLKLLEKGYKNVWTPYAEAYHHESVSRGAEDNEEKQKRFQKEVEFMMKKWGDVLYKDRFYNANLTLEHENFGIKI